MRRGLFTLGNVYFCRYRNWFEDPIPRIFVLWSDQKHTEGFNLNYMWWAKHSWRMKTSAQKEKFFKTYRPLGAPAYRRLLEDVQTSTLYNPMAKILNNYATGKMGYTPQSRKFLLEFARRRYPLMLETYRRYDTRKLRIIEDLGQGIPE